MSASSLAEAVPVVEVRQTEWSLATRVAFRFCFAFLILFNLPFPLDVVPRLPFEGWVRRGWSVLVALVAQPWFGVAADVLPNGSGDTTWNWIQLFLQASIAASVTLVWSIADRRATSYPRLHRALRVYVRFALAVVMISYGAIKMIPSQFPSPGLDRLVQTFGDASPMGLLWTFMGASAAYSMFTGFGEVLGGLLLTTRRTALAGALVSAGVMAHVVALNFCYDVPVKIFSSMLLFEALFLLAPDLRRLCAFLFAAAPHASWWKIAIRTSAVLAVVAFSFWQAASSRKEFGDLSPRSPLRGIWNVTEMSVDGVVQPPLLSNETRWRRMIFDYSRGMSIQLVGDQRNRYGVEMNNDSFVLKKRDDPAFKALFTYQRPSPKTLVVDGTLDGKRIHAAMQLDADKEFLLQTRGFHWINEYPFNR